MIRFLHPKHGSFFREKRMLRMAPDHQEQIRQLQEQNAALQKQVEELKTTTERLKKSMEKTKKVVNNPNFPVRQNGVALPRAAQNSPAARDPRMQARMRQMGSVRNLDSLLSVIPASHRSGRDVKRCDPIPQPWTPEQRANIYEPTHPTMGRIRFENKNGQWVYKGIVMTPDELYNDQLGIQQKYADQDAARKHRDAMLSINLARARSGQPLPKDMQKDYETDRYLYQIAKGRIPPDRYDPNNIYNKPGYTFIPNTIASKRAAMGNRPVAQPVVYEVRETDEPTPEERNAATQKAVNEKMRQLSKSLQVETFMLPGMMGDVGDGSGGSGLSMKILVPEEVSGIRGMNQITYMVGSGRFRTAAEETMARRAGITFLAGGGELEVHFAKPGKFSVWSEAGYDVYGPATKRRIVHTRRDFEVKGAIPVTPEQLALEQQKLNEAKLRPVPSIWGDLPQSGINDPKGNRFMYRYINGVLQAYTPTAGLHQYNEATGNWFYPGKGIAQQYALENKIYAVLFPNGQLPVVANQPQQQPVQQPVAPNKQVQQPQQQPVQNQQPEKPKMDLPTFKNLLAREGITVDDAWLKDDATWGKLKNALGSLGDVDYKYLKGKTISMPGTNFPNANGFVLPNDPDQDRVNEQLRMYVEIVKKNPAPQPVLKIESVPNEEEKPAEVEKPKTAGVEKNDTITEAQPDLSGLLPENLDDSNVNRAKQKNQIIAVENGQTQFVTDFQKNVDENGLLLTKSEVAELFGKYKNGNDREKNLLKPILQTIEKHLTSKVSAAKETRSNADLVSVLPERLDFSIADIQENHLLQKRCIEFIINDSEKGKADWKQVFQEKVNKDGLIMSKSEASDLFRKYDAFAGAPVGSPERIKSDRLESTIDFIKQYLASKVPALNEEPGVLDAPNVLPDMSSASIPTRLDAGPFLENLRKNESLKGFSLAIQPGIEVKLHNEILKRSDTITSVLQDVLREQPDVRNYQIVLSTYSRLQEETNTIFLDALESAEVMKNELLLRINLKGQIGVREKQGMDSDFASLKESTGAASVEFDGAYSPMDLPLTVFYVNREAEQKDMARQASDEKMHALIYLKNRENILSTLQNLTSEQKDALKGKKIYISHKSHNLPDAIHIKVDSTSAQIRSQIDEWGKQLGAMSEIDSVFKKFSADHSYSVAPGMVYPSSALEFKEASAKVLKVLDSVTSAYDPSLFKDTKFVISASILDRVQSPDIELRFDTPEEGIRRKVMDEAYMRELRSIGIGDFFSDMKTETGANSFEIDRVGKNADLNEVRNTMEAFRKAMATLTPAQKTKFAGKRIYLSSEPEKIYKDFIAIPIPSDEDAIKKIFSN